MTSEQAGRDIADNLSVTTDEAAERLAKAAKHPEPQPDGVHVIPVPRGWSAEQAWEAIKHDDDLPDHEHRWAVVLIKAGMFVHLYDGGEG